MNVHELIERNRNGESIGLPSFCTANQHVLEATLGFAAENELPVLIEATCNYYLEFELLSQMFQNLKRKLLFDADRLVFL